MKLFKCLLLATLLMLGGCASDSWSDSNMIIAPGADPNFTILTNFDKGFAPFNRKVDVFGIAIYAVPSVADQKLLHAANIMAQYLDNDEDGNIDNPRVIDAMLAANAFMVMWKHESDLQAMHPPDNATGQDLGNDETMPAWHANRHTGRFDASLEEVWHIISHAGLANAYPDIFGEDVGSTLANAMDIARGDRFLTVPGRYPAKAWYTYDDRTCDYPCMITEYFYWAITSILGAQANRLDDIEQEWDLHTKALVQAQDTAVYNLLMDSQYKLPTRLPDGTYRR